jgi:hypothetical protein
MSGNRYVYQLTTGEEEAKINPQAYLGSWSSDETHSHKESKSCKKREIEEYSRGRTPQR